MTTTIAVKQSTRDKLRRIMKEEGAQSLDQAINSLMEKAERVPKSMFGVDKSKNIRLSRREHEDFQR
jgi:N-methylhydantoinase B/oxoprolinase/acetone carboxylase alpha subunit